MSAWGSRNGRGQGSGAHPPQSVEHGTQRIVGEDRAGPLAPEACQHGEEASGSPLAEARSGRAVLKSG
jgi:hypothetical protein